MKIKKVRSDNGTEFKNANVDTFIDKEGISHEFSATYAPQQNGVVERKNWTLIEMARTMLDEYKTQNTFGRKRLRQLAMQRIVYIFTSYSARRHTSFSSVTNPKLDTFGYSLKVLHS